MSRRTRRTGPVGGPCDGQAAGWDTDRTNSSDTFPAVGAHQVIATLPRVLALGATGRVGTEVARLEHLEQWLTYEEDPNFTTLEKATLVEALRPHMGPATLLAEAIARYQEGGR